MKLILFEFLSLLGVTAISQSALRAGNVIIAVPRGIVELLG